MVPLILRFFQFGCYCFATAQLLPGTDAVAATKPINGMG